MRILGRLLFGASALVLVGGVLLGFSYADTYGWKGWREELSHGWWILVVAAVPAMAGWLVRIAQNASR